ncbi:hypothetical protein [Xanthomonas phage DES1]|nr:hypothetical protein [Xanthomonas phage DES1]
MNRMLFAKTYDGEDVYDLAQDMQDFVDYNPELLKLPKDKDGIKKGTFHVSIIWHEDK